MADGALFEDEVISFAVPGAIVPWARAGGRGHQRFTPAKQRAFMADLRQIGAATMGGRAPIDGPVALSVLAVWAWPKSVSQRQRGRPGAEYKISVPDADNVSKIVGDALNQVVWTDDARVCELHVYKRWGERPGLTIEVRRL